MRSLPFSKVRPDARITLALAALSHRRARPRPAAAAAQIDRGDRGQRGQAGRRCSKLQDLDFGTLTFSSFTGTRTDRPQPRRRAHLRRRHRVQRRRPRQARFNLKGVNNMVVTDHRHRRHAGAMAPIRSPSPPNGPASVTPDQFGRSRDRLRRRRLDQRQLGARRRHLYRHDDGHRRLSVSAQRHRIASTAAAHPRPFFVVPIHRAIYPLWLALK